MSKSRNFLSSVGQFWTKFSTFISARLNIVGYGLIVAMTLLLPVFYTPFWQACDDPFIAMLIKGYGLADSPSLLTTYSNVVWATLVSFTPDFFYISGYTWIIYFFSCLSLFLVWANLAASRDLPFIKTLFLVNLGYYILLNPQYTVTAFFCAFAGFLTLSGEARDRNILAISLAFALLYFSFIIRAKALCAMLLLCLPILDWKLLKNDKYIKICFCVLIILVGATYALDSGLKSGPIWGEIKEWQKTREDLADANSAWTLLNQSELIARHGISENDLRLAQYQFGGDPGLRDSSIYATMKNETDFEYYLKFREERAKESLEYVFGWPLIIYIIIIGLLILSRLTLKNAAMVCILFISFWLIGFFSRGGADVNRVYYPLLFAVICALMIVPKNSNLSKIIYINTYIVKISVIVFITFGILFFSKDNLIQVWRMNSYDFNKNVEALDNSISFGWPTVIEWLYKPFDRAARYSSIKFQCLIWPILDQNIRSFFDPRDNNGFKDYLAKGGKFTITDAQLKLLDKYCQERMNGELTATPLIKEAIIPAYRLQCKNSDAE